MKNQQLISKTSQEVRVIFLQKMLDLKHARYSRWLKSVFPAWGITAFRDYYHYFMCKQNKIKNTQNSQSSPAKSAVPIISWALWEGKSSWNGGTLGSRDPSSLHGVPAEAQELFSFIFSASQVVTGAGSSRHMPCGSLGHHCSFQGLQPKQELPCPILG